MPGSNVTPSFTNPVNPIIFENISAFNTSDNSINLGTTHNFSTGNLIWADRRSDGQFFSDRGISLNMKYFVIVVNSTTIKLATSFSNATNNIPVTISTSSVTPTAPSFTFTKYYGYGTRFMLRLPDRMASYTKSFITFNSDVPVEITFTVPSYSTGYASYTNLSTIAFLCGLRQVGSENFWSCTMTNGTFRTLLLTDPGITPSQFDSGFSGSIATTPSPSLWTSGYQQKYIITPNRTIEYYFGAIESPSLVYSSVQLASNISLQLEFGSSFDFCKLTDCSIKL